MKRLYFLCLLISIGQFAMAQADHPGCDGLRFRSTTFSEVNVTEAVLYGSGTTIAGNLDSLYMDIYEPAEDGLEQRPTIILAFGGAFISGERQDLEPLCRAYASQGYVAVTIDYRIYDLPLIPFPSADQLNQVVIQSMFDMRAAIRFLREDADTDNEFRIDPNYIYAGGVSAGAICAAHTAVLDENDDIEAILLGYINENGGFEGNSSDNFEYSSEVSGVINFSGALGDADWLDSNAPPFVSIHEDMDPTVPYGAGFANVFGFDIAPLEGSQLIHERAESFGITNELRTLESSDHVGYFTPEESFNSSIAFTSEFVHNLVCPLIMVNTEDIPEALRAVDIYPNPTADYIRLQADSELDWQLALYDGRGRVLLQGLPQQVLDVANVPSGTYHVQVTDNASGTAIWKKVVIH